MGHPLGSLVARAAVPVKDWETEDDGTRWGAVEAFAVAAVIVCIYVAILHDLAMRLLEWLSAA